MPTFSASQVVGKTLTALKQVPVYSLPYDSQNAVRYINSGQTVGVVYSYVLPANGRKSVYWMFLTNSGAAYYVKHDSSTLKLDGSALTIEQEAEQKKDFLDKIINPLGFDSSELTGTVMKVAIGAGLLYGAKLGLEYFKILKPNRRKK